MKSLAALLDAKHKKHDKYALRGRLSSVSANRVLIPISSEPLDMSGQTVIGSSQVTQLLSYRSRQLSEKKKYLKTSIPRYSATSVMPQKAKKFDIKPRTTQTRACSLHHSFDSQSKEFLMTEFGSHVQNIEEISSHLAKKITKKK